MHGAHRGTHLLVGPLLSATSPCTHLLRLLTAWPKHLSVGLGRDGGGRGVHRIKGSKASYLVEDVGIAQREVGSEEHGRDLKDEAMQRSASASSSSHVTGE